MYIVVMDQHIRSLLAKCGRLHSCVPYEVGLKNWALPIKLLCDSKWPLSLQDYSGNSLCSTKAEDIAHEEGSNVIKATAK